MPAMKKLFIAAFVLSVITSWFSVGRYHADEQYQILEFVGFKKGINEAKEMPWEFQLKMRPIVQVAFAFGVINLLEKFNLTNPFIWAFILRLFSALLGLFATNKILQFYKNKIPEKLFNTLCFLSLFYCFIPYFHVRFSSENISSSLFFIGLFGMLSFFESRKNVLNLFLLALIIGLAGVVRLQTNFLLIGFLAWIIFIKRENFKTVSIILLGIIFANVTGVFSDKWFYGSWEISSWNYLYNNIILNKVSDFGVQPFWFYFKEIFLNAIPPFSLILFFCFGYLIIRLPKNYLTWTIIPFLLVHFATAHKELRFLFVLIPIIPLAVVLTYNEILNSVVVSKIKSFLQNKKHKWFKILFLTINTIVLLILSFKAADSYTPVLKFVYDNYNSKPTVLMCESKNYDFYSNAVSLNFYRSKSVKNLNFPIEKINPNYLQQNVNYIFVCGNKNFKFPETVKAKLVYNSIPDFLYYFNFNGWIEREGEVCVYEVSNQ